MYYSVLCFATFGGPAWRLMICISVQYNGGFVPDIIQTWTPLKCHYAKLRTTHHRMLLRILGAWCKSPNKRILSYKDALHRTQCESIETTVRTMRLLWAGALLRMGDHRLPKRVMSGELENAGKRGPGGKEKEWTDCVADDLRLFGVTGDWKTAALDPGAWYNTVPGTRRGL